MKVPLIFDETFSNNKANLEEDIEYSKKYLENEIDTILKYMDDTFLYIYRKGTAHAFSRGKEIRFPVFLMELAECTLADIIRHENTGNKIAPAEKVKIIRDTVNTISHLHSMNVLHRDLSPDNIFVVDRGRRISYVLGDFGTSKRLNEMDISDKSSKIVGHSAYLDPTRFEEKYRYDFRADVYSLGIIIVEILMGELWLKVFGEENISHIYSIDFEKDFLLKEGPKYIEKDIIEIIARAVKRNPEERYESVDAFRQLLFDVLEAGSKESGQVVTPPVVPEVQHSRAIYFDFYFSVSLPFDSEKKTLAHDIIPYREGKKIELRDYRGAKIGFKNFSPKQVKVLNTPLYAAVPAGNSILLNFKNKKFTDLLKTAEEIQDELAGNLYFKGAIEASGIEL
jgi:serine/threonine protein kinase